MPVPRIYADFNGLVCGVKNRDRTGVALDTFGSIRDLANAGLMLREGMPLVAFDESDEDEDLEGHGTAEFDHVHGRWIVEFDEFGVRYVPAGVRGHVSTFRCVKCGFGFPHDLAQFRIDAVCPSCGADMALPIAPP